MATPADLTRAIADGLGIPQATVTVYDRYLRQAGLRSKAGHGRGAARVTPRDAAHLLTAILGGELRDAPHTVRRYADTTPYAAMSSDDLFGSCGIDELASLPPRHSFIDALETLVAAASFGTLSRLLPALAASVGGTVFDVAPVIEIGAVAPGTAGDIRIGGLANGRTASVRYLSTSPLDEDPGRVPTPAELEAWEVKVRKARLAAPFEHYRRTFAFPILHIAAALASRKEER